jgi:addiction module HigA family antidote
MAIERNDAWANQHLAEQDTVVGPIHPGEILLEDFLKPMGISQNQLAIGTSLPSSRINGIVKGTRGISAETALRFGRYFGTSAEFWLNLQSRYDLLKTQEALAGRIEREVRPLAYESGAPEVFASAMDRFPE